MKSSAALALVWFAACGHSGEEVAIATPARLPERIAVGVPHGGPITLVAITEQGDAALSKDSFGELRLWPSLDGKRPPVPISGAGVDALALSYSGEDLLVALLDQAGSVRILRVAHDGTILSHAQVPGDVACQQVVAIDNGVLVVRADESIERYDAAGKLHGRLVPDAGERIGSIATRSGTAAALIEHPAESGTPMPAHDPAVTEPETATILRWIVLRDELAWGTTVPLAAPVFASTFALAPSHRRIGVIDTRTSALDVIDLEPLPKHHDGPVIAATPTVTIGFADDDHCALINTGVQWWTPSPPPPKPDADPWAVQTPSNPPALVVGGVAGAVGDGVALMGFGPSLAIVQPTALKYLGWKTVDAGGVAAVGNRLALAPTHTHVIWLDDQLAEVGDADLSAMPGFAPIFAVWIDPHHAVAQVPVDGKQQVLLIDTAHLDHPTKIGTFPAIERLEYHHDAGVLAIGSQGALARYTLDLATLTAKELPALRTPLQLQRVWLLDPARADGLTAITASFEQDGQHLQRYRSGEPGKVIRSEKDTAMAGTIVDVDASGTIYVFNDGALEIRHEGRAVTRLPTTIAAQSAVVSHDGHQIMMIQGNDLTLADAHGVVRWQRTQWGTSSVVFTADDRRVVIQTAGGLVALDANTGDRVATACGFGFGLQDVAPPVNTLGATPVCEETP